LHLGNILSFAITAALAQKTGAKVLLRIDDLDQARADEVYIRDIFDSLTFLGIHWDEGPNSPEEFQKTYSQKHRLGLYSAALQQLADEDQVYACLCSRKKIASVGTCSCMQQQIPLDAENASWRLKTITDRTLSVKIYNGLHLPAVLPAEMRNFIVKKKDGFPAYQLTSVIDDLFYAVDLIVRGDDLWPSTLAQIELSFVMRRAEFRENHFFHHPLLLSESGDKLSKSAGATSINYLRQHGHSPADIWESVGKTSGINHRIATCAQFTEAWLSCR